MGNGVVNGTENDVGNGEASASQKTWICHNYHGLQPHSLIFEPMNFLQGVMWRLADKWNKGALIVSYI